MTTNPSRCWLPVVSLWAATAASGASLEPADLLAHIRACGLRCDSVTAPRLVEHGLAPVSDCQAWSVVMRRGELQWSAGLLAEGLTFSWLRGPALLRNGRIGALTTATQAAAEADAWFERLGFALAGSEYRECTPRYGSRWYAARARLVAPQTISRAFGVVELDRETGALVGYERQPDLHLPDPLPTPRIGPDRATELSLDYLRQRAAIVRLDNTPTILRVRRVLGFSGTDRPVVVRSMWSVEVGGRGHYLVNGATCDHYWSVRVADDGEPTCEAGEATNHRFIGERELTW